MARGGRRIRHSVLDRPERRVPTWVASPYRSRTRVDDRGRLSLDRRARTWLAVGELNRFDVVVVPAPDGGLLVVPVEDFARRWEVLTR